jgi:hypothetical protein
LKPELIKRYKQQSFKRWAENNTDYEKLVHLVVDDVLTIVQASKPSKTQLTLAIKLYFGLESPPETSLEQHEHTNKNL